MFYQRLLDLCDMRGFHITKVVSQLGMGSGNLSSWKSGNIPKGDTLVKLADYFNVSTDYLLGRTDIPEMAHPLGAHSDFSHDELHLLAAYRRADDHARELVALALKPFAEASAPPAQSDAAV